MKILHAYCLELGDIISIDVARRHFTSTSPQPKRYNFFCSDVNCAVPPVRITGVNYDKLAAEHPKFLAAHFRQLDAHNPQCQWVSLEKLSASFDKRSTETEFEHRQRLIKNKLTDLVNVFDPTSLIGLGQNSDNPLFNQGDFKQSSIAQRTENSNSMKDSSKTKTASFERLVETYIEAKQNLTPSDFYAFELNVVGTGSVKLHEYFCHINKISDNTLNNVIFGGAFFGKRYGDGFSFKFMDFYQGTPLTLYISSEKMNAYRFKNYFNRILSKAEKAAYVTIYAIGHVATELSPKFQKKVSNLVIENLNHLVVVLGPEKTMASSSSESIETK
jgi:hypothetical protein